MYLFSIGISTSINHVGIKNPQPIKFALKKSKIPGCGLGVYAKEKVPIGSWIGPYKGNRIPIEKITKDMDMSYMWEVSILSSRDISRTIQKDYVNQLYLCGRLSGCLNLNDVCRHNRTDNQKILLVRVSRKIFPEHT